MLQTLMRPVTYYNAADADAAVATFQIQRRGVLAPGNDTRFPLRCRIGYAASAIALAFAFVLCWFDLAKCQYGKASSVSVAFCQDRRRVFLFWCRRSFPHTGIKPTGHHVQKSLSVRTKLNCFKMGHWPIFGQHKRSMVRLFP